LNTTLQMVKKGRSVKRIGKHRKDCSALAEVRSGKKKMAWMTPQFVDEKLFYVCTDPNCEARLVVLDVRSISLPKL
jgi:hypothetical protein